jgi:hypothetical protein
VLEDFFSHDAFCLIIIKCTFDNIFGLPFEDDTTEIKHNIQNSHTPSAAGVTT